MPRIQSPCVLSPVSSPAYSAIEGKGAWTPANIDGLVAWYNAKRSTITKSGSNQISQIDSLVGSHIIKQTTGSEQPTYITDDGFGDVGINFDRDRLVQTDVSFNPSIVGVFAVFTDKGDYPIATNTDAYTLFSQEKTPAANRTRLLHGTGFVGGIYQTEPVLREEGYGANDFYLDNVSVSNNTAFSTNEKKVVVANLTLAAAVDYYGWGGPALGTTFKGKFYGNELAIKDGGFTADEIQRLYNYALGEWSF